MKLTVKQLAERIGAKLEGSVADFQREINTVSPAESAGENSVTFLSSERHRGDVLRSRAAAVIVSSKLADFNSPQLIVGNVNAALIQVLTIFAPKLKSPQEGIDPTAQVASDVKIGKGVSIGVGVVVENGVEIGNNTVIAAGCKIGQNTKLGESCRLDCNVVIYHSCVLGNNIIIQANSTIGSIGFGYAFIDGAHRLIPHNGGVIIEDFVEIGANCCVDRAKFGNTIIGAGTKIDNIVQVAHNVVIGKLCLIAAQSGISGSTKIGDGVVLGGQVGLADHIEIGSGTMIGAKSGVTKDFAGGLKIIGIPAMEGQEYFRLTGLTRNLPKIVDQLKQISKRLEELEAAKDHKTGV
jgi:UDP-3-O-[3-hydroxymyristoyl] glucosamine N-acyltransferase